MIKEILEQLNPSQREAVEYNEGASLVIAGAGSGKTRVLTYKIAYLLEIGYDPSSILALTFTNKAAREMKNRIAKLVGAEKARRLWMGTFHSIFSRILRSEATLLGYTSDFTIYDTQDSKSLLRSIIKELGLDEKLYKPQSILGRISMAKNNLITPSRYIDNREIREADHFAKIPRTVDVYTLYQERCRTANAMDFDDLLLNMNILLRDHPEVEIRYQSIFRYIMVDEYQDTNLSQHIIVQRLAATHGCLCVVGDDAQSIYSFRGANIENILHFSDRFTRCQTFKLEQNYRSTQMIVNAANSLIAHNQKQLLKAVFSKNESGNKLMVISASSDLEEARLTVERIREIKQIQNDLFTDFVVLYRTNAQSRVIENALRERSIPYRIYGGQSFYQRKEIKDILSYLRLIINRSDEEALKRIINVPTRGIGDTTLNKLLEAAHLQHVTTWDVLVDPLRFDLRINSGTAKKLSGFVELIERFCSYEQEFPLQISVAKLIKESGLYGDHLDKDIETLSARENMDEFINGIAEYVALREEEGITASLSDFLSEVALITDQDTESGEETDYVTLMTVHASKGLEFKHVIIVGLEEELFPMNRATGSPRELEEERRLLYVAITRAEQTCTLTFAKTRFRHGMTASTRPSRFIGEIDPRYLKTTQSAINPKGLFRNEDAESSLRSRSIERAQSFSRTLHATQEQRQTSLPIGAEASEYRLFDILPEKAIVEHERFGQGTVIESDAESHKAVVEFESSGRKTLLLRFARLRILS